MRSISTRSSSTSESSFTKRDVTAIRLQGQASRASRSPNARELAEDLARDSADEHARTAVDQVQLCDLPCFDLVASGTMKSDLGRRHGKALVRVHGDQLGVEVHVEQVGKRKVVLERDAAAQARLRPDFRQALRQVIHSANVEV